MIVKHGCILFVVALLHANLAVATDQVCPYIPSAAGMTAIERAIYNNETAMGHNIHDSSAGAIGPMQIMPSTFDQYARPGENIREPDQNMQVGRRIIADLKIRYHNNARAIMIAYNAGIERAKRWIIARYKMKNLPTETQHYVIKGLLYMARNPDPRVYRIHH